MTRIVVTFSVIMFLFFIGVIEILDSNIHAKNFNRNISDIEILRYELQQLDTIRVKWQLSEDDLLHIFQTAIPINNIEAANMINKQYLPMAYTGSILCDGQLLQFILTTCGVIIIHNNELDIISLRKCKSEVEYLFPFSENAHNEWTIKILQKHKWIGNIEKTDSMFKWAYNWDLTASEIDKYISLCKKESIVKLYSIFMNYPCAITGFAVYDADLYYFSLECSGMTWMKKLIGEVSDEENFGFGCYDKQGLKYIYTIENNLE